mgnify:CR=1 FL=1
MKYIHFPFVLLTILLACNLFTACNDDEGGGVPVIHHIRLVDPCLLYTSPSPRD